MKATIKFFDPTSCHLEWSDNAVWFNPTLAELAGDASSTAQTSGWCLIGHTDDMHAKSVVAWAHTMSDTRFVAPDDVAEVLISAGLPASKLFTVGAETKTMAPGLRMQAVKNRAIADTKSALPTCFVLHGNVGSLLLVSTSLDSVPDLEALKNCGPIHTAFFPVGEPPRVSQTTKAGATDAITQQTITARAAFHWAKMLDVQQLVTACSCTVKNGLYPEELRLVHERMGCPFNLLVSPAKLQVGAAKVSVVIRTLNEAKYLGELLEGIANQQTNGLECEVVLVDSGSTDQTLSIAEHHGCRILHIKREDFSFGRSLNLGCEAASGDILVITSGHCVPADTHWLYKLCEPLLHGTVQYSYGKQLGGLKSHFSEHRVFEKYFPLNSQVPQAGYYCNNANSALLKAVWNHHRFDEDLTGLEDMELAQRLAKEGGLVGYVAEARVFHHHSENWAQVRRRFEREAIALQKIKPNVHVSLLDAMRYIASSVWKDWKHAANEGVLISRAKEILLYRYHQYIGSYKGNHEHRKLSHAEKDKYFYPH